MNYFKMSKNELEAEKKALVNVYEDYKSKGLSLNMARGKPSPEQLDLSQPLLDSLKSTDSYYSDDGTDCRNYGGFNGILECRQFFGDILGVSHENVFVGGNSSLN